MQEIHVIVIGRVQGIGFRAKVKQLAESLHLTGYVRNLSNGDVEICAQGDAAELNHLTQQIQQAFTSYIQNMKIIQRNPNILHSEFRITLV